MRTTLLPLCLAMYAALMLASCVTSPSPEEMQQRAEKNRWELDHWGDRRLPHGDHGEAVVLAFKGGKVSGHAGCNQYSAEITFGPDRGSLKVSRGITTRMACDASRSSRRIRRTVSRSSALRFRGRFKVMRAIICQSVDYGEN